MLSGLTHGASLVLAPKTAAPIRHIEFVSIGPDRALVVLVTADGQVENRLFTPPAGPHALGDARGGELPQRHPAGPHARARCAAWSAPRSPAAGPSSTQLSRDLVEAGTALWAEDPGGRDRLIVHGRAHLIEGTGDAAQLERIRELFDDLERKRDLVQLLDLTEGGEGVRVFIGSENKLFSLSGSSLVVSPYMNADRKIIGAVGVIGPTRLNYGRIVPIVDYTAQLVGRLVSSRGQG